MLLHSLFSEDSFHKPKRSLLQNRWTTSKQLYCTNYNGTTVNNSNSNSNSNGSSNNNNPSQDSINHNFHRQCQVALDGTVLIGPDTCGKTLLMFQLAYNLVRDNLERDPFFNIVILCSRSIPAPSHIYQVNSRRHSNDNNNDDSDEESESENESEESEGNDGQEWNRRILSAIHMKYVDNGQMLTRYLSHLHFLPREKLPRFLLFHHLSQLIGGIGGMSGGSGIGLGGNDEEELQQVQQQQQQQADLVSVELENQDGNSSSAATTRLFDASHMKLLSLIQNTTQFLIDALVMSSSSSSSTFLPSQPQPTITTIGGSSTTTQQVDQHVGSGDNDEETHGIHPVGTITETNASSRRFVPSFMITDLAQSRLFYDRWCGTIINVEEKVSNVGEITVRNHQNYSMSYTKLSGGRDIVSTQMVYGMRSGNVVIFDVDFASA